MIAEFWDDTFRKKKNSTKIPDFDGVKKEVVIKGNFGFENQFQSTKCSVIAPSFFVTGGVGYGYCKVWNNYYWITNVSFDINGAEYITCKIDVLASWRSFILDSVFHVERCADVNYFNPDIFDEALSIEDGAEESSSAKTSLGIDKGGTYLVTVLGRSNTGLSTYAFSQLPGDIFNPLYSIGNDGSFDDSILEQLNTAIDGLGALIKAWLCNPGDYIVAVKFAPFNTSFFPGTYQKMYAGWWETGLTPLRVTPQSYWRKTLSLSKPGNLYSDFRRTDSRCSMYNMYLPGVGTVDLSPDVIELSLSADITMSVETGSIHYNVKAGGATIGTYDGNVYHDIGFGGSSINSGAIAQTAGGVGAAASGLPSKEWVSHDGGISEDPEVAGGNGTKVALGIVAAIHGAGEAMKPQASLTSPMGADAAIWGDDSITISAVQKHTAEFPLTDYGRPCCKNLRLGDLTGFVKCSNASIDIASALPIREEINTYLNTGFFIE